MSRITTSIAMAVMRLARHVGEEKNSSPIAHAAMRIGMAVKTMV